jgi:hypothetical protein
MGHHLSAKQSVPVKPSGPPPPLFANQLKLAQLELCQPP